MSLSPEAFEKLLAALGPGREQAGETYERIRQRLLRFFEWRRADCPEDLTDRTIDRVGKRLEDGKVVPLDVQVGDRILFGKYSGSDIKLDGEEYMIMREDEVLGILEAAPKEAKKAS